MTMSNVFILKMNVSFRYDLFDIVPELYCSIW